VNRATALIRSSVIEKSFEFGVAFLAADATIENTLIRETAPQESDGAFGDGVCLVALGAERVTISSSRIETSARAAVSSFSGTVSMEKVELECNAIDLDAEHATGATATFEDRGDNICSCAGTPATCQEQSANLAPPEPLESLGHR
jgi:hypothetical protein